MNSTTVSKKSKLLTKLAVVLFWILVWQIIYMLVDKDILVASPFGTAKRLLELVCQIDFWQQVLASCIRVFASFILALVSGIAFAVLTYNSKILLQLFSPIFSVIKATPVASFIVLALIWMKSTNVPVFSGFLMVFPIVWSNIFHGISSAQKNLLEMAYVYKFSFLKKIKLIYIPAVRPYFLAAATTGFGIAWKSCVAAEVIAYPKTAIGSQIYNAKIYLLTSDLFALTATVIILSILLEKMVVFICTYGANKLTGVKNKTNMGGEI